MRRILVFVLVLMALTAPVALAQQTYTHEKVEYTFEIPSANWRSILEPEPLTNTRNLFTAIGSMDTCRFAKKLSMPAQRLLNSRSRDQDLKLRFLPGFVEGKQEPFNGRLDGVTMSYEFVRTGKPMLGRIYYLQADNRTSTLCALPACETSWLVFVIKPI